MPKISRREALAGSAAGVAAVATGIGAGAAMAATGDDAEWRVLWREYVTRYHHVEVLRVKALRLSVIAEEQAPECPADFDGKPGDWSRMHVAPVYRRTGYSAAKDAWDRATDDMRAFQRHIFDRTVENMGDAMIKIGVASVPVAYSLEGTRDQIDGEEADDALDALLDDTEALFGIDFRADLEAVIEAAEGQVAS